MKYKPKQAIYLILIIAYSKLFYFKIFHQIPLSIVAIHPVLSRFSFVTQWSNSSYSFNHKIQN